MSVSWGCFVSCSSMGLFCALWFDVLFCVWFFDGPVEKCGMPHFSFSLCGGCRTTDRDNRGQSRDDRDNRGIVT
jgi:hypothetical protein